MKEYTIHPSAGVNAVELWQQAYREVHGGGKIVFAPGRYDFYPENCSQRYCYFSNNDEGVKTIALDIVDTDDLEIFAEGAEFIFHGRISPLVADNCRNISVHGMTIDFEDSFVSDADLVEVADGISYFKFGGKHAFKDGKLVFTGDFYDNMSGKLIFYPYDTAKKELVWQQRSFSLPNKELLFKDGLIGFKHDFSACGTGAFAVKHELRLCPGVIFAGCTDVKVSSITLHHAAGMGFLFQCCKNIRVDQVRVCPRNRRASASDDALHAADCRGVIEITNSHFSGTLDDCINIHGICRPLRMREPGGKFYYLDSGHFQQAGLLGAKDGDTLILIKNDTLKPYGEIKIDSAMPINKAITKVVFDESALPPEFSPGDCAMVREVNHTELKVRNCYFAPLSSRGVLASGLKDVEITGNTFHTAAAAIFVAGDAIFWHESGPVQNMVISGNVFDNCSYYRWISAREPIGVFPEIQRNEPGYFFHKNITVKNNIFRSSRRNLVSMRSVANAVVEDNEFIADDTYYFMEGHATGYFFTSEVDPSRVVFKDCGERTVRNNTCK